MRLSLRGMSSEEMALRRQATFAEILQTEENYVKDLQLVIDVRAFPALFWSPRLSAHWLETQRTRTIKLHPLTNTPLALCPSFPCWCAANPFISWNLPIQYFLEPIRKKDMLDKEMLAKLFSNWEERTVHAFNTLNASQACDCLL